MSEGLAQDLRVQIGQGNAIVIAGAGVAAGASGGIAEASWIGLLHSGVAWCQHRLPVLPHGWADAVLGLIALGDTTSLVSAAELVTEKMGGRQGGEYRRWLRETLGTLVVTNPSVPRALVELGIPIATTNYDGLLEAAIDGYGTVTWRDGTGIQRILRGDRHAIVHLHGHWDDPESVVLGIRSYEAVLGDQAAQALQRAMASVSTMIFVGVGLGADDPNFGVLRSWLAKTFPGSEYRHFRLCRESEVEGLATEHQDERIVPVSYGVDYDDLAPFLRTLAPPRFPSTRPKIVRSAPDGHKASGMRTLAVADSGLLSSSPYFLPGTLQRK